MCLFDKYADDGYFKHGGGGQNQYGYNNNDEHILNIPPPPGVIWAAPAPLAPQRVNSDLSNSSFSGPHGPVLPPPHPTVALGFNQSSFTYDELSAATGGFSQRNLLGQGGFGYVHKGKGRPVMDWGTRLKIAVGSAKGLAYLHEDCHPRIIHRDIKAANILIENNFEAKVADFGLAKFTQDTNTHVSTRVMGTFGYLAPEYASSGKLTDKSDVFSFGVMLLELITGRRPVDRTGDEADSLVDWSRPLCAKALENGTLNGLVDPRLEDNYNRQQMICMVACAAASFRHSAKRRPRMSQIVRVLEGDVSQDVLNVDGVIPGQSGLYSSTSGNYDADMAKFKKLAFGSSMASSELGVTSEYGLNPSTSSSEQSSTEYDRRTGSRMHTP
ncbi:hypothetical protein VNO77_11581 [Canavalia gladiata]|uniref:non-specific serine/threonine protein kinase n=1 Tax=Canavalia gladiata TaxID=3824 RepID=A0AAN9MH71_CANGL